MRLSIILAACCLGAVMAGAQPVQPPQSVYDQAGKDVAVADGKLNTAYARLIDEIKKSNDPERAKMVIAQLREAERAWLRFRDAQVQFVGMYHDIGSASARAAGLASYKVELTQSRIADLTDVPDPF